MPSCSRSLVCTVHCSCNTDAVHGNIASLFLYRRRLSSVESGGKIAKTVQLYLG